MGRGSPIQAARLPGCIAPVRAERERALEKLPLRQQERIRKNLEWFDGLAKPDQAIVLKRAERYEAMSPEARQAFNQQFRALAQLPPDRRQALGAALRRLQTMSDEQRAKVLASPAFHQPLFGGRDQADLRPVPSHTACHVGNVCWNTRSSVFLYCFQLKSLLILLNHLGASVRNQVHLGTEGT